MAFEDKYWPEQRANSATLWAHLHRAKEVDIHAPWVQRAIRIDLYGPAVEEFSYGKRLYEKHPLIWC